MFALLGVAGLLVSVAWMRFYRDRAHQDQPSAAPSHRSVMTTCKLLLTQRTVWGMMLGWSGINYTVWLYTAWVPGYLQTSRHLDLATSGWLASIPFLFGALGMASSGFASDFCVRMGVEPAVVYRVNLVVGMPLSALGTFVVGYSETTTMAIAGISAALFFVHFAGTSGWGYAQIMGAERYTATLGALMNFASFLFASLAPVMTGWLLDRTHSFTLSLELCGVIMLLGAVSYLTLAKPPREGNLVDALKRLTRSSTY
jgi:cyanate permease